MSNILFVYFNNFCFFVKIILLPLSFGLQGKSWKERKLWGFTWWLARETVEEEEDDEEHVTRTLLSLPPHIGVCVHTPSSPKPLLRRIWTVHFLRFHCHFETVWKAPHILDEYIGWVGMFFFFFFIRCNTHYCFYMLPWRLPLPSLPLCLTCFKA